MERARPGRARVAWRRRGACERGRPRRRTRPQRRRSPPQAKPGRVRYHCGSQIRTAGTPSSAIAVLRTWARPRAAHVGDWPVSLRRSDAGVGEVDGEEAALLVVDPGGDEGVGRAVGQRAPRLDALEGPRAVGLGGEQALGAFGGVHLPEPCGVPVRLAPQPVLLADLPVPAGLAEDRQCVEVRLGDAGQGEVDRAQAGQRLPQCECVALHGQGQPRAERTGDLARGVEIRCLVRGHGGACAFGGRAWERACRLAPQ